MGHATIHEFQQETTFLVMTFLVLDLLGYLAVTTIREHASTVSASEDQGDSSLLRPYAALAGLLEPEWLYMNCSNRHGFLVTDVVA